MNKEPIGLYIFRFILGFGLFAFMAMLYWSSVLLENNVKEIHNDLSQIRTEVEKVRIDILKAASSGQLRAQTQQQPTSIIGTATTTPNTLADNSRNILEEDPFYEKTLPQILGDNFHPSGTLHLATYGKPQNLHPFNGYYDVMTLIGKCTVSVTKLKFGIFETMTPYAAERMEERINPKTHLPEYWVFLRKDLFWEPLEQRFFGDSIKIAPHFLKRHPVTAHDFKLYWDAFMNPYVSETYAVTLRTYFSEVESFEVIDDYTFVVRWQGKDVVQEDGTTKKMVKYQAKSLTGSLTPFASFVFQYYADGTKIVEDDQDSDTYRKSSIWAQNLAQHWAKNVIPSCGAWKFDEMTDQRIVLKRNTNFYDPLAALTDVYELNIKSSTDAIWQDFKAGNTTLTNLQPDRVSEWHTFKKSPVYLQQAAMKNGIHELEYLFRSYSYVGWNQTKPYFMNKKVRQALTMAIDRRRIIQQNMDNLAIPIHGTFFVKSSENDPSIEPFPFNPQAARKILEEEGWYDSTGKGILDKEIDGKRVPFSFRLTYYVKNPTTKSIVEYISTALKEIGIDCQPDGQDIADLTTKIDDKTFDAYFLMWTLGSPPTDPRQLWYSTYAKVKGSSNTVGFVNKEADQIIDKLEFEYDPKQREKLYHRFDAIIHEEQPYTFLFTPKIIMLYREPLKNVFIPSDRKDLVPGADISEPDPSIYWLKEGK